ncbi:MAG TPA: TIGR01548 family HAD-type hydrolase, partial [Cyanobacteria bacterium UBA11691]|nr:TIGR01548 family HAD-type hydrolase [Cyanobacteria bacterium UBA11691]
EQLDSDPTLPVFYVGDTVADMKTVERARAEQPDRLWVAIGVLPPHVQETPEQSQAYAQRLESAGAQRVFKNVEDLAVDEIKALI